MHLQEIDGVLHKIIEKRVDQFNVQRIAVKLSEEEFAEVEQSIAKTHAEEAGAIARAKTKKLPTKKELELEPQAEAIVEPKRTDVLKRKAYQVGK